MKKKYRCFALFSGGLDSMLAVLHMHKLGYEVIPIFFETPFFNSKNAKKVAESIGFELMVHDLTELHLEMLKNPRYGFGKNMNPCIDCHGLMFKEAGRLMKEYNVDFLISGEVMGQRPMSQRKDAMNAVGKLSEVKDLLVRPLSQKLLTDTLPIREEWVMFCVCHVLSDTFLLNVDTPVSCIFIILTTSTFSQLQFFRLRLTDSNRYQMKLVCLIHHYHSRLLSDYLLQIDC